MPLSLNAPGSPSSQLTKTYFLSLELFARKLHFTPVENAAPPLPLKPESLTIFNVFSGSRSFNALLRASYPPFAMYWFMSVGDMFPQFSVAILLVRDKGFSLSI